jgi:NDP-sugar pyrophosphorylase family protein
MGHLTDNCPKPMLKICGKHLLQFKFEALPDVVKEVILVVGYLKEQIINFFGDSYSFEENGKKRNIRIKYIEQEILNGTAGSLWLCKDVLEGRFFVLMGDDIDSKSDLEKMLNYKNAILAMQDENAAGGKFVLDEDMFLVGLNEDGVEMGPKSAWANTAVYLLDKEIFTAELIKRTGTEYGLPHTIVGKVLADKNYKVKIVETTNWIQVTNIDSIPKAEKILCGLE